MIGDPERIEIRMLRLSECDPEDWARTLDAGEHQRAGRYVRPDDRDRFRLGRGLLRAMLGTALGVSPESLVLRADRNGKPTLPGATGLAFNVAHSADLVCVAVGQALSIGVDVEHGRHDLDPLALGFHVLTDRELRALEEADDRFTAFFETWVMKEAVLKGIGTGLLKDPREIEIAPSPNGPRIGHVGDGPDPTRGWQLRPIAVPEGYHGALAVLPKA